MFKYIIIQYHYHYLSPVAILYVINELTDYLLSFRHEHLENNHLADSSEATSVDSTTDPTADPTDTKFMKRLFNSTKTKRPNSITSNTSKMLILSIGEI